MFCESAIILFLFHVEFLGIMLILIYVGAIAVLFLFIVMMLNIKNIDLHFVTYFYFLILISFIIIQTFYLIISTNYNLFDSINVENLYFFNLNYDMLSNLDVFGQLLYNNFLIFFLIIGLILLIPIIGAVILTLNFKIIQYSDNTFLKQITRTSTSITYLS